MWLVVPVLAAVRGPEHLRWGPSEPTAGPWGGTSHPRGCPGLPGPTDEATPVPDQRLPARSGGFPAVSGSACVPRQREDGPKDQRLPQVASGRLWGPVPPPRRCAGMRLGFPLPFGCSEPSSPLGDLEEPGGGLAAQGSAPHWCDLGVFRCGWAALWCPAVRVLAWAAVPAALSGPPLGGHLCPSLGSPGQHPEAGLLVAGCSRERRVGGTSGWACPGGARVAQRGALRSTELCLTGCHRMPFYAGVSNAGMVGRALASCPSGCAVAARPGTVWGRGRDGTHGCRAGQRTCRARTWPLSAATTLGTRYTLSSSEFPFSVFVSFLLTFFPSGIKGWMGTMVTGWCGQPGPAAGVAPGRGQQRPVTRLRRSPRKGKTWRVSACVPGTAGEREPALPLPTHVFHRVPRGPPAAAACLEPVLAHRRVPPAAAAGCVGRLRASDQTAGDLGGVGAHPRLRLSPSRLRLLQPSCRHAGDVPSLGPLLHRNPERGR